MNYRRSFFITTCLAFGFAFLYIPILSMVVFSFNASKLVTVWDSANSPTLKWYYSLLHNEEILDAAWISLKVAVINASGAVILGTLAGFGLARFAQFRGRFTLNAMTTAPLVMPEVITGLSHAAPVRRDGAVDRLAGGPRHHDDDHRAHDLLHGLCHGGRAIAHGDLRHRSRGGGDGLGRAPGQGVLSHHAADHFSGHPLRLAAGVHALLGRSGDLELHLGPGSEHACPWWCSRRCAWA